MVILLFKVTLHIKYNMYYLKNVFPFIERKWDQAPAILIFSLISLSHAVTYAEFNQLLESQQVILQF